MMNIKNFKIRKDFYKFFLKPFYDKVLAFCILALLSPFIFLLILILTVTNNGKIFFIQTRAGKEGKPFKLLKFRTMNDRFDESGNLLPDVQRITNIGNFLRKTSLDELPQLINVLTGDMSMVGPRPLLMDYIPLYNERQKLRLSVKPGITGWAQVNGRNALSWKEKFELDVWYVNNLSFCVDVRILLKTFIKVIKMEGINSSVFETMKPFSGNC